MQKLSTSKNKTDLNKTEKKAENAKCFQPKTETLNKILQFASSYRAERITENQYVEWYLN